MGQRRLEMSLSRLLVGALYLLLPLSVFADAVIIGAENDASPWSFPDGSGYVNDLVRAAYKAVDWKVTYEVLPYSRCKLETEAGQLVACFSVSKTPETEKKLQFPSMPVFAARNVLLANGDSPLNGCDPGAWGHKISVGFVNKYEYLPAVETLQKSGKIAVMMMPSEVSMLGMMSRGRLDAVLITLDPVKRIELVSVLAKVKPYFKVVCDYGDYPAYIAFNRANPQTAKALAAFNKGMTLITKSGDVARLQKEWASTVLSKASAKP
jgi:polar amino acid transport system substrate-binding protein